MRGNTQDAAGVGTDAVVAAIEAKVRTVRASLPHAANGRPKAPSNAYAAQIGKDMQQGTSREVARLYAWLVTATRDGVDVEVTEAPLLLMVAGLRAAARVRTDRPLLAVMRQETRAQATLDLAQLRLAESPTCVDALECVLAEAERYTTPLEELKATVRERLTVIRTTTMREPARRGAMQVMR